MSWRYLSTVRCSPVAPTKPQYTQLAAAAQLATYTGATPATLTVSNSVGHIFGGGIGNGGANLGLTKTGSLEYAGLGIRVNAVLPGAIDTPMLRHALVQNNFTEEDFAPALSLFGRFGKAEEVGEASAWLCSDASSYVTGHSLAVEGGYLTR